MIKYIFAVLFFVSHAIPAGSQPATHDARPSVSPPSSSVEQENKKFTGPKLRSLKEVQEESRALPKNYTSIERESIISMINDRRKAVDEITDALTKLRERMQRYEADPSDIPEARKRDYNKRIKEIKERIAKNFGNECSDSRQCTKLLEEIKQLERLNRNL